jgi:hypothetical protein
MIATLSRLTLRLLGWSLIDCKKVDKCPRAVYVFVHTSPIDWIYFILYLFAYPHYAEVLYLVCRTRLLKTGTIQEELQNKDKFMLLISTNRMTLHNSIKTARQLRCSIRVIGLDYNKCNLFIGAPRSSGCSYKKLERRIINGLKQTTPACVSKAKFLGKKGDLYPCAELFSWLYTSLILTCNIVYHPHVAYVALIPAMYMMMGNRYLQSTTVEAMMFVSVICGFVSHITPAMISAIFLFLNCITSYRHSSVLSYFYLTLTLVSICNQ